MRIAVVCADLGIRIPGDKGADRHLLGITRGFAAAGHDVLLVAVGGHGPGPDDLDHVLLPHPGRADGLRRELRKLRFSRRLAGRVGATVDSFGPDLVYERLALFGSAARPLARRAGCPHVLEVNALLADEDAVWRGLRLRALARRRERQALASADLRVAVSAEVADRIASVAAGPPTVVVPNGVDGHRFADLPAPASARARLGLPSDRFLVGFAGALRPWHGLSVAIDALAQSPAETVLVVAGDGPVRAELAARAAGLGVAHRVIWLGQLAHETMPAMLAALDVAVAPYPDRPDFAFSPLKVVEYLAAGVPTVASDLGQLRALVGGTGQLVPAGDAAALADAWAEVRRHPDHWRAAARVARRETLARHTWRDRARDIVAAAAA